MEDLSILKHTSLFSGLTQAEIRELLACLTPVVRRYARGDYILHAGDSASQLCLVLDGCAHVIREDIWGRRNILTAKPAGSLFAEIYAAAAQPLDVSVVAVEPCTVLFIAIDRISAPCSKSCSRHARIIENLLVSIASQSLQLSRKLMHMSCRTTREKLMSYLSEQAQLAGSNTFTIPFNRQQLADFLAVDRSAMCTELTKMQQSGIISFTKNEFIIH